jgi:hypothetical protein
VAVGQEVEDIATVHFVPILRPHRLAGVAKRVADCRPPQQSLEAVGRQGTTAHPQTRRFDWQLGQPEFTRCP